MTNTQQWPAISRFFHWLMAVLIFALLVLGWSAGQLDDSPLKIKLYVLHKSLGLTVLMLVVLRLLHRLVSKSPKHTFDSKQLWAVRIAHAGLYGLMFAMPLSGWILNSAANYPLNWFGLIDVPTITTADEALKSLAKDMHEIMAWILVLILAGHIAAATWHHKIIKDDVWLAMKPNRSGKWLISGLVLILLLAVAKNIFAPATSKAVRQQQTVTAISTTATAEPWQVQPSSQLQFIGTYDDIPFTGKFSFNADINFDDAKLDRSGFSVTIDVTTANTNNQDRDSTLAEREWFDYVAFPKAKFVTGNIEHIVDDRYLAKAQLTIRNITREIDFPFVWQQTGSDAKLFAEVELNRLDYDIGTGMWVDEIVGHMVRVQVSLNLTR